MRCYKSSEAAAAAVVQVSRSSQPSSTHLSIFPFLKLATLSFAIPPPISVSVRSRQAGTETEREASAMEALGPGKWFKRIERQRGAERASRVRGACAQMRRFTGGRGCSEASTCWRENTPRPSPSVSVYVCVAVFTPSRRLVCCPCSLARRFIGLPVVSAGFYLWKARTTRRVGAGIVWVGI